MLKKSLLLLLVTLFPTLLLANPPPAEAVFQIKAFSQDSNNFFLEWTIKPGYFLYKDRVHLKLPKSSNASLGSLTFPAFETKTDKQGKVYDIYRNLLQLKVPILGEEPGEVFLSVNYQGCSDEGYCYPPQSREVKLSIDNTLGLSSVELQPLPGITKASAETLKETAPSFYQNKNLFMIALTFFGLGLLLAFTPCVLPMIPVLSGIIVGHGETITSKKAFFLSLSYVLSMAITYAYIGAIFAIAGKNLQVIMQSPFVIFLFSLLFVLLSLSMFGFYDLKLPESWQAKIASISRSQGSGHYFSAALMGCLSTLILSPCVSAPLIGAITYIAQEGKVITGMLSLFFMGLGMGFPLLLIGTSAGKLLPKAGLWMNSIKAFFGICLLGIAIYLLGRLVPGEVSMLLWAILLIVSGIFAGAISIAKTTLEKIQQAFGILALVYGLILLLGLGLGLGNVDPLYPLQKKVLSTQSHAITVTSLKGLNTNLEAALGKPVLLDYYADWCASCKVLEKTVFQDPEIQALLKQIVVIKLDVTQNNADSQALYQEFNVIAPPTFIFINTQGEEEKNLELVGEFSARQLKKNLLLLSSN